MKIYFARMTNLYGTDKDIQCLNIIKKIFPDKTSILYDPKLLIENRKDEIEKLKGRNKEKYIMDEICYKAIDNCEYFVYILENDDIANSPGVRDELKYAINKSKTIYRIFETENGLSPLKMDKDNIIKIISKWSNPRYREKWALKTVEDYKQFYEINPEAVNLIIKQFEDSKSNNGECAIVPHLNSCYKTNNFKDIIFNNCREHQALHSFYEVRTKEFKITCPFTGISSVAPIYSKLKLDKFSSWNIWDLLSGSRTIHRTMNIYDHSVFKNGIVLRSKDGTILNKGGKSIADLRKIIGCIPTYDFDIKMQFKDEGFFDDSIFKEFSLALELSKGFLDENWPDVDWKLGFSGNGMYIILDKWIFEDNKLNYSDAFAYWKYTINFLNQLLEKNGIRKIQAEQKYGWNRYFKVMCSFHLSKDRLSIPLNKDKELDKEWIDFHSDIKNGLKENIFKEIMEYSGWRS